MRLCPFLMHCLRPDVVWSGVRLFTKQVSFIYSLLYLGNFWSHVTTRSSLLSLAVAGSGLVRCAPLLHLQRSEPSVPCQLDIPSFLKKLVRLNGNFKIQYLI